MGIRDFLPFFSQRPQPTVVPDIQTPENMGDGAPALESVKLDRRLVVVDIGCRWGFAEKFTQQRDDFYIYGFDPDTEECARLQARYAGEAVTIVPRGLAGAPGKRTLYITQEPACSSLLKPDPDLTDNYPALHCAREMSTRSVQTTTLDQWAIEQSVDAIDHIKIDTQGTELEILRGGRQLLGGVRSLELEVEFNPIYLGQPVFSDVDQFLRSRGFVLWKLTNQVHYARGGSRDQVLGEDIICYDDTHRLNHSLYDGQLFWANAHYVNQAVLKEQGSQAQQLRDIVLFEALGMSDVVLHLNSNYDNLPGKA